MKTRKITLNELKTLIRQIIEEQWQSGRMDLEQSVNYLKANYKNLVVRNGEYDSGKTLAPGKAFVGKLSMEIVKYAVNTSAPLNKMKYKSSIIEIANEVKRHIERVDHRALLKKFMQ